MVPPLRSQLLLALTPCSTSMPSNISYHFNFTAEEPTHPASYEPPLSNDSDIHMSVGHAYIANQGAHDAWQITAGVEDSYDADDGESRGSV